MHIINGMIGAFGVVALVIGTAIQVSPAVGERFFGDWSSPRLDAVRAVATSVLFVGSYLCSMCRWRAVWECGCTYCSSSTPWQR